MLVPKAAELVAAPYRFGGNKRKAQEFFETGLGKAFEQMRTIQNPEYPLTVYYAFKQSESDADQDKDSVRYCFHWLGDYARRINQSRLHYYRYLAYAYRVDW